MEPIFSDKEVRDILNLRRLKAQDGEDGSDTVYYKLAKAVRDAVEDKFHIVVEQSYRARQEAGMKHVQEIGRLLAEARRED